MNDTARDVLQGMTADELATMTKLVQRREALLAELQGVNAEINNILGGNAPVRVPRDKNRGENIVEAIKAAGDAGIGYEQLAARVGASAPTVNTWLSQNAVQFPALVKLKDGTKVRWQWNPNFKSTPSAAEGAKA
ncbi:MAG: hypothetical protein NTY01_05545 [Verrucomicrobia bacterium]|nr:hypothetical protein [Verrucomicrobiota bacterium]